MAANPLDYSLRVSPEFDIGRETNRLIGKMANDTITPFERQMYDYLDRLRVYLLTPRSLQGKKPMPPTPPVIRRRWRDSLFIWWGKLFGL